MIPHIVILWIRSRSEGVEPCRAPQLLLCFFLSTQPSLLICLPRAIAREPAGTSSVIDEPAAT